MVSLNEKPKSYAECRDKEITTEVYERVKYIFSKTSEWE